MDDSFRTLVAHFARAMFRGSEDTETELSVTAILGMLAVPGALLSLTLLDKYSSLLRWIRGQREADALITSIPDKYFFIVCSMVVTGLVVVVQWDRILPGRIDFLNLAPLPISLRAVFAANLMAIILMAGIFAIVVNGASCILFPAIVTASQQMFAAFFSFAAIHALCVAAASAFAFFSCLAVMGLLMALLPHGLFRRISLYIRVAMVMALVALLATSFSVPMSGYLPPVWYLALYQSLQGRATPGLEPLAAIALPGLGAAFLLAIAAYALSYRRYFLRLPEMTDRGPSRPRREWPAVEWLLRSPFQLACYRFGMKTLLRRESHSIVLGAFIGFGLVTGAQTLASGLDPVNRLEAALTIAYTVICGMRVCFDIPAGLKANWIFRASLDGASHESAAVARKMILTILLPGVIVPAALLLGLPPALYVAAFSALPMEIALIGFRKIPFTCPPREFGSHVTLMFAVALAGFVLFPWLGARAANWAMLSPGRIAFVLAGWLCIWFALRQWKKEAGERDLDFGEVESSALQLGS